MPDRWRILVPIFLVAQAALVHWAAARESPPAIPTLARLPVQFADWKMLREDPLDGAVVNQLGADQFVSRTYVPIAGAGLPANLFIAWYQTQRGGSRQPHSPQVCLPGSGWTPQSTGQIALATAAGSIPVNRYVVTNQSERAVVLYWYQTPRRVMAGEWAAKFWLVPDAILYNRTDTSLIRVTVWSTQTGDAAATAAASAFARNLYPLLRAQLP